MVEALKIFSLKVENVMKNEEKFNFPELMRIIRKSLSLSRKFVCQNLGCSQTKILFIEKGIYGRRGPEIDFVLSLAEFYGMDINFTIKKFREFMKSPERPEFEKAQKALQLDKTKRVSKIEAI